MIVAVIGAAGQLGRSLCDGLRQAGYEVEAYDRQSLDFAAPERIREMVSRTQARFVVNACAYTAVDNAEDDVASADQVNHLSVGVLGEACASADIPVIHVSTDYVFDGRATSPYKEIDDVDPTGVYGATKLAGEKALVASGAKSVILRTSWVFGEHGKNFVKTMVTLGAQRDSLSVVGDQWGSPTYVGDIVAVILTFLLRFREDGDLPWGVFHCSSAGACSWYEFACAIFDRATEMGVLSSPPAVERIPSSAYPTRAERPAYSVLDCSKLEAFMQRPMPHWRAGLENVLQGLMAS